MQRSLLAFVVAAGGVLLGAPSGALAADAPPSGAAEYVFKRANCVETSVGYRSVGIVKTLVHQLPADDGDAKSRYYQKVSIQIDKQVIGNMWRKVDKRTYDWSRFTRRQKLPTWSTSGIRTGLMDETHTLTAKATMKLKRERPGRLPDKTIWEYTVRSAPFECINPNEGVWGGGI
jgi:hypothetical protein